MRIIKVAILRDLVNPHPDAKSPIESWIRIVAHAHWKNFTELRHSFPDADLVKLKSGRRITIFNICRNQYRLLVAIHFNKGIVYVQEFLTHKEYSKEKWKQRH